MAVKVMVAPAIATGELEKRTAKSAAPIAAARPKRRRSSVYDADGNEVFITLMCLKCHKMRPLSQFGLRRMADGAIRNQPWCRTCRSAPGERPARDGVEGAAIEGSPETAGSPPLAAAEPPAAEASASDTRRNVAAEIAAALAAGMRR